MRILPILFALLIGTPCLLEAEPVRLPEHNFSVEVPAGWSDITPRPPQAVVAAQSADHSKRIVVFAMNLPANEKTTGAADVRAGARKSIAEQGWRIDPEQSWNFGGLPFIAFVAHVPDGGTVTAYTTGAGDKVYMIQAFRGPAVTNDADLLAAVQSFRLLSPAEILPLDTPSKSGAYRAGYLFGRYAFFVVLIAVVWLVIRGIFKRKAA